MLNRIVRILSSAELFCYLTLWLIFLLIIGTISQKYYGLFYATQRYFYSDYFLAFDLVPLPASRPVLFFMFLGLLLKIVTDKFTVKKIGSFLAHLGVLLLLLGGFISSLQTIEGSMVLKEGQEKNYIEDYQALELVILDGDKELIKLKNFKANKFYKFLDYNFKIKGFCYNCAVVERKEKEGVFLTEISEKYKLVNIASSLEIEENISGVELEFFDENKKPLGFINLIEDYNDAKGFNLLGRNFSAEIRSARTYIPFVIELIDFKKISYTGSNIASHYESKVRVRDENISWLSLIEMNKPLRHKGYSFYQSSFFKNKETDSAVFAVVKNNFRLFYYISSFVIFLGLFFSFIFRVSKK